MGLNDSEEFQIRLSLYLFLEHKLNLFSCNIGITQLEDTVQQEFVIIAEKMTRANALLACQLMSSSFVMVSNINDHTAHQSVVKQSAYFLVLNVLHLCWISKFH